MKHLALGHIPTGYWKGRTDDPRNPYILIQYAIVLYNDYLMKKSKSLKTLFIRSVDSLVNRLVIKNNFGVWPYYCLFPRAKMYGCRIPWISALAQGQGISALLRAYSLVNHQKYLETADYALKAFSVPMIEGGVLSIDSDDNHWWYEEYASPRSKPSGVLNGFIFALLGIHDFYLLTHNDSSKRLFDNGISTLRHHVRDFDTNCPYKLTYYDRQKHIVSFKYHSLHVKLMEILHRITKQRIFRKYQEKWEMYREEWGARRMYRWLSMMYHIKSCYNAKDSMKLALEQMKHIRYRRRENETIE